ncbi:hypothetical protein OIU77_026683 [Salix suchowensis]|uniref:Uncharacterized protein n=1 Tax=Salix suchowensis TaxID=1278906 RepID=A0ABQ9BPQ0_9ROSI|nr:hypothetical protein OIU77_026683 [Salix suchowensis]
MATWIQHFLLFSSLALCVLSARPVEDHAEQNLPTVQIINSLPPNSPPLNQKDTYSCAAQWQRYIESWNGYELPRDENHGTVYWLVKKDGFYRSWDKASWELENPWGN